MQNPGVTREKRVSWKVCFRSCPRCGAKYVHVARMCCVRGCSLEKGRDRPKGTTRLKGSDVSTSGGRPVGFAIEMGYSIYNLRVPPPPPPMDDRAIRLPWDKNFALTPLGQTVVYGKLWKIY